eukprot:scaffold1346_cov112-Cylindrotheca_fusiformis.AAC.3
MTQTSRNNKTENSCSDEYVPIAFVAAPLGWSGDRHEEQQISPEMVEVVTEDEQDEQRSASSSSPFSGPHQQPEALVPAEELDPSAIQVVTFDEPSDNDTLMDVQGTTNSSNQQRAHLDESTPLLPNNDEHQDAVGDYHNNTYFQGSDEDVRGGARYRDIPWAVAFWLHFATVLYLGIFVSPKGMRPTDDIDIDKVHDFLQQNFVNQDDFTDKDLEMLTEFLYDLQAWWAVYPPRILVFLLTLVVFAFFLNMRKAMAWHRMAHMVHFSLVFPIVASIVVFLIGLVQYSSFGFFFIGSVIIGVFIWFVRKRMWPNIHFAAVNLQIALVGIGNNKGTYILAFFYSKLAVIWIFFWCYTTFGFSNYLSATYCVRDNQDLKVDLNNPSTICGQSVAGLFLKVDLDDPSSICGPSVAGVLVLMVSFYWTWNFISNTAQVYVAGVMATWCFDKDTARGWFSPAVTSSMYRSLTFSTGPIAFGSLLQGSCKTLRSVLSRSKQSVHNIRDVGDDCRCCCFGVVGLILDCISDLVGDVLDYFSQWAYVFVGIYGHSYLESGKEAMTLFRSRGFMALITDRIVKWSLSVAVFVNGILTGLASILLERLVTAVMSDNSSTPSSSSYIFGIPSSIDFVSFL